MPRTAVRAWREDYNTCRPQSAPGNIPPAQFAAQTGLDEKAASRADINPRTLPDTGGKSGSRSTPLLHDIGSRSRQSDRKDGSPPLLPNYCTSNPLAGADQDHPGDHAAPGCCECLCDDAAERDAADDGFV